MPANKSSLEILQKKHANLARFYNATQPRSIRLKGITRPNSTWSDSANRQAGSITTQTKKILIIKILPLIVLRKRNNLRQSMIYRPISFVMVGLSSAKSWLFVRVVTSWEHCINRFAVESCGSKHDGSRTVSECVGACGAGCSVYRWQLHRWQSGASVPSACPSQGLEDPWHDQVETVPYSRPAHTAESSRERERAWSQVFERRPAYIPSTGNYHLFN